MPESKQLTPEEKWEQATLANNFIFYKVTKQKALKDFLFQRDFCFAKTRAELIKNKPFSGDMEVATRTNARREAQASRRKENDRTSFSFRSLFYCADLC